MKIVIQEAVDLPTGTHKHCAGGGALPVPVPENGFEYEKRKV